MEKFSEILQHNETVLMMIPDLEYIQFFQSFFEREFSHPARHGRVGDVLVERLSTSPAEEECGIQTHPLSILRHGKCQCKMFSKVIYFMRFVRGLKFSLSFFVNSNGARRWWSIQPTSRLLISHDRMTKLVCTANGPSAISSRSFLHQARVARA